MGQHLPSTSLIISTYPAGNPYFLELHQPHRCGQLLFRGPPWWNLRRWNSAAGSAVQPLHETDNDGHSKHIWIFPALLQHRASKINFGKSQPYQCSKVGGLLILDFPQFPMLEQRNSTKIKGSPSVIVSNNQLKAFHRCYQ